MAMEFFHPFIPSFFPSFIRDQHTARLWNHARIRECFQEGFLAIIEQLFVVAMEAYLPSSGGRCYL